jgi:hypothetical protein
MVRILNTGVLCYAPGFVMNDSVTMTTDGIRAVFVAVARREVVLYCHCFTPEATVDNQIRDSVTARTTARVAHLSSAVPTDPPSVLTLPASTFRANLNL